MFDPMFDDPMLEPMFDRLQLLPDFGQGPGTRREVDGWRVRGGGGGGTEGNPFQSEGCRILGLNDAAS